MDNLAEDIAPEPVAVLSYDDTVAYEAQLPTEEERAAAAASLANRIGTSKVYLLSESSAAATRSVGGKRKHSEGLEDDTKMEEDDEMTEGLPYRPNALLLNGSPIANLPTTRIFAYATHFDAHPLGLEWVDDTTCVLVFDSRKAALDGFSRLLKSATEEPDMDDCVTARPFPIALWPPEERIKQSVGQGEGLKGTIRMRWAKPDDVKKRGAMKHSQFYKKHGSTAGKEIFNGRDLPPAKRRRREDGGYEDEEVMKAQLDHELDQFLAEDASDDEGNGKRNGNRNGNGKLPAVEGDDDDLPPSPPSKMRSDYIAQDGRTLLERTSHIRLHNAIGPDFDNDLPDLASRITAPLPQDRAISPLDSLDDRLRSPRTKKLEWGPGSDSSRRRDLDGDRRRRRRGGGERDRGERERGGRGTRTERPMKTQQELDDELDAFLRGS
ncbi:hypothetical protein CPB84DRAFT_1795920 [Gymnopilus junonius]|uniref:Chromatin target of PRMT1 protein C-terminal domain-containing protein n=1 Tax=Gymnopilus junonius TaxID=109634 RepID=A0A9P5NA10_GYMJU|nr:hypothetical protein CPB84DRAFT_1795920 [Gymnopilus junonius]